MNLDCALGLGGPQKAQFQKNLVSRPLGSPQALLKYQGWIKSVSRQKEGLGREEGFQFPYLDCILLDMYHLLSIYHHPHLYNGNSNFLSSYLQVCSKD